MKYSYQSFVRFRNVKYWEKIVTKIELNCKHDNVGSLWILALKEKNIFDELKNRFFYPEQQITMKRYWQVFNLQLSLILFLQSCFKLIKTTFFVENYYPVYFYEYFLPDNVHPYLFFKIYVWMSKKLSYFFSYNNNDMIVFGT